MATTQLLPRSAKLGRRSAPIAIPAGFEIVEGLDRLWLALRCPAHAWSWPRANGDELLGRYDSHQTCHKCTSRRMFDTQSWQAGPICKRRVR
ncbi:hypothetical protein [Occallatibacter savannae]|uniref:hypothetical protein n=1 Tax=Occallatibacter savannae TaxID=1002691 RepID=UPI000D698AB9|nr:hypothetical protein [Occallatibacter savannae]